MQEIYFDQQISDDKIAYDHFEKIATGQLDDFVTGSFLLEYLYFKEHYKPIAIDLSKKIDVEIWNKMEIQDVFFITDFHCNYIKTKYENNSNLMFTDTDSLVYDIETSYVYEDF